MILILFYYYRNSCVVFSRKSDLEINSGRAFALLLELIILARENGIEDNADDGGNCETGEAYHAEFDGTGRGVVDADGKDQDESCNDNIAGVGEVDSVFHNVAHTDC